MKAKKLLFGILTTLMLFAFQNCGQEFAAASYKLNSSRGNAMDPGKVAVGPAVWPRTDSTVSNPTPLTVSRAALPTAVDFGANSQYDESTMAITWGNWISTWKSMPLEYHSYLGTPKYLYRLDMFKNAVVDLTNDDVIYKLSKKEVKKLNTIISSSILANARQFSATAACTPSSAQEYASLETDYGMFDLGAGQPCAIVDLFKNDNSGNTAGLQEFLSKIQQKF